MLVKLINQIYKGDIEAVDLFKKSDNYFMIDLIMYTKPFQAVINEVIFGEGKFLT